LKTFCKIFSDFLMYRKEQSTSYTKEMNIASQAGYIFHIQMLETLP